MIISILNFKIGKIRIYFNIRDVRGAPIAVFGPGALT